jgi:hypothetical protein
MILLCIMCDRLKPFLIFSLFQERMFIKILLLSSVLDLRHTAGGRFNPAIPQVHFALRSCQFSPFSIALHEFNYF